MLAEEEEGRATGKGGGQVRAEEKGDDSAAAGTGVRRTFLLGEEDCACGRGGVRCRGESITVGRLSGEGYCAGDKGDVTYS